MSSTNLESKISLKENIKTRENIAYGLGDVACNVVFALTMSMSTYFYTNVVGMSAALVGTILMISRIFDGVSDAIIGVLVDRTKSKHGKARAWVLWMIVPYGVTAVLMFMVPPNAPEVIQAIYVFITYNLAVTIVYTALNLPYGTMAAMMTRDQGERSILNVYRMSMSPMGALLVTAVTMPLINAMGGTQRAWILVTTVYALIAMVLLVLCFLGCKERVHFENNKKEKPPLGLSVRCMLSNKYWWMVLIMFLGWSVYFTLNSTMLTYYAQYELGNSNLMSPISVAEKVPSIIAVMVMAPFIKRFGKRNIALLGSVIVLVGAAIIWMRPTELPFVIAGVILKGIGGGAFGGLIYSLLADTIEYGHWRTGVRSEGLLYSACSVGYKVGGGLVSALIGFVMELSGFDGLAASIPQSAHQTISALFILGPVIAYGLIALILCVYRLDKEYPGIMNELEQGQYSAKALVQPKEVPTSGAEYEGPIIVISRENGSGGREIGSKIAQKLGIPFYDKKIIADAAEQSGVAPEDFEQLDKGMGKLSYSFAMLDIHNQNDRLFILQSQAIRQLAAKGSCVMVGRCADYILRNQKNVYCIFINANTLMRASKEQSPESTLQLEVRKKLEQTNAHRRAYYEHYTGQRWGDAANYDLCIDSSLCGAETADIICDFIKRCRYYREKSRIS